jgi:hypothetical protein
MIVAAQIAAAFALATLLADIAEPLASLSSPFPFLLPLAGLGTCQARDGDR